MNPKYIIIYTAPHTVDFVTYPDVLRMDYAHNDEELKKVSARMIADTKVKNAHYELNGEKIIIK